MAILKSGIPMIMRQGRQYLEKIEGELLAVIDPRPFQAALQQAQGALARDGSPTPRRQRSDH